MRAIALAAIATLCVSGLAHAQTHPAKPNTSYNKVGSTVYGSDGTTYNRVGSTTYGSDGSTASQVGSTTYVNRDQTTTTYNRVGSTTYGSDGTTSQTIGNTTYVRTPEGKTVACQKVGSTTYCN